MGAFVSKWKSPIRHAQKIARATFPALARARPEKDKSGKWFSQNRTALGCAPLLVFIDGDEIEDGFHNSAGLMAFGEGFALASRPQGRRFDFRQSW